MIVEKVAPYLVLVLHIVKQAESNYLEHNWQSKNEKYRYINTSLKIMNGKDAKIVEFPYQAVIFNYNERFGGTLITMKHVLTAAHCTQRITEIKEAVVEAGSSRVHGGQKRRIVNIYLAETNSINKIGYDLAIIELNKPFKKKQKIKPIELIEEDYQPILPENVFITGFGLKNDDDIEGSSTLQVIYIPLISEDQCKKYLGPRQKLWISCAGDFKIKKKICAGDSGGPVAIMFNSDNNFAMKLIGISRMGTPCNEVYPGISVFTKVSFFIKWIKQIIGDDDPYLS